MNWKIFLAMTAISLGACTQTKTIEVPRPYAVPCVKADNPALKKDVYAADVSDLDENIDDQAKTLLADREQRRARELELRALLEACIQPGS